MTSTYRALAVDPLLREILEHRRPAGGRGVSLTQQLICNFIEEAGHIGVIDEHDNIICHTKHTGVLFSCHTDTMHDGEGLNEIRVDEFGITTAWSKTPKRVRSGMCKGGVTCHHDPMHKVELQRDVLGADDGAGIYIMLRMIEAGIYGTYVFHADEEIGCVGSQALASETFSIDGFDLATDFTHAIAFDRKGTSDVVYDQMGEVMCSNRCRIELMARLNVGTPMSYKPAIGLVTDTAMYSELVPECINLSVGYYDEHTNDERLDLGHLEMLLGHILDNQDLFENLPVAREKEPFPTEYEEDDDWEQPETVSDLCMEYPLAVADLLESQGYDYEELFNILNDMDVLT